MAPGSLRLGEIVARFGGELIGDPQLVIHRIATLRSAGPGDISFLVAARRRDELAATGASAVIVPESERDATTLPRIVSPDPYAYFARLSALFNPPVAAPPGIHPQAVVSEQASVPASASIGPCAIIERGVILGENVIVGAACVVGEGASIGAGSRLHPRVTIYPGCAIGARAILHSGAVIGADGFGFAPADGTWLKIPQTGRVVIGDDVEIGANTTVDRGTLDDTVIEDGVKLDNQVQIGHNCRIGSNAVIAGCTGVAGSTTIGRGCMIGGAAMIGGHLEIADGTVLLASTAVSKSITKPGTYGGMPAQESRAFWRSLALIRGLERMAARLRELERQVKGRGQD